MASDRAVRNRKRMASTQRTSMKRWTYHTQVISERDHDTTTSFSSICCFQKRSQFLVTRWYIQFWSKPKSTLSILTASLSFCVSSAAFCQRSRLVIIRQRVQAEILCSNQVPLFFLVSPFHVSLALLVIQWAWKRSATALRAESRKVPSVSKVGHQQA